MNIKSDDLSLINMIRVKNDVLLPGFTLWRNGAINFNLIVNTDKTETRNLTRDEINDIIDKDYSQVDGLYKYSDDTTRDRSIFISRTELYNLLSKKYFYATIVFSYKLDVDRNSVICIKRNKK